MNQQQEPEFAAWRHQWRHQWCCSSCRWCSVVVSSRAPHSGEIYPQRV